MANDLPTIEANTLEALTKNSKRGIKSYTQGGRRIEYESLADLLEALAKARALQPATNYSVANEAECIF